MKSNTFRTESRDKVCLGKVWLSVHELRAIQVSEMSIETKIVLGNEYDDALRDALRAVLIRNGAVGLDKSWAVFGSQEIENLQVQLGDDRLEIEAETFVGLSIYGRRMTVEKLASQVRKQLTGDNG